MGLSKESIFLLMQEGKRRPFTGNLITLGRQDISATYDEIVQLAKRIAYPLHPVPEIAYSEKPEMKEEGLLSDNTFFKLLGFKETKSMDVSNYESADIVFDLNQSELSMELCGAFEVVLDGGTIEHVFHIPNSLKNIFRLLSVGGARDPYFAFFESSGSWVLYVFSHVFSGLLSS
ncbi:MAG TPA: hypothetical protein VLE95_00725 [Chlamydiales bacterium]|nr:hypothetical protein [Chlamydiales bacterium]